MLHASPNRETERGFLRYDGPMSKGPDQFCTQMNETCALMREAMDTVRGTGPRRSRLARVMKSLEPLCPQDQEKAEEWNPLLPSLRKQVGR